MGIDTYPTLTARYWECKCVNTLRPRQNGRHFPDDIFNSIFLNENVWTPIKFSLKFVPKGPIDNIPALFQIMAWRRPGDKPLSETMVVCLPTHICVTRPQWVRSGQNHRSSKEVTLYRWWHGNTRSHTNNLSSYSYVLWSVSWVHIPFQWFSA